MNKITSEKARPEILGSLIITAKACLSITLSISVMGLLGYIPGLRILGAINVAFIPMAPSTALAFIFLGAVLMVFRTNWGKTFRVLFYGISGFVLLFGLAKFIEVFFTPGESFETNFVTVTATLGDIPVGIMSPSTGAVFFLSSLGIISFLASNSNLRVANFSGNLSGFLASLVAFSGVSFVLGYLYEQPFLYGKGSVVPMALTTAIAFIFLGTALICMSGKDFFPLKYLVGSATYAKLLRGFLPLVLFVVLVMDFLEHYISNSSIGYNKAIISSLSFLIFMTITAFIVFYVSRIIGKDIDRAEIKRLKAEEELLRYASIVSCTSDMMALMDTNFIYLAANDAYLEAFDMTKDQVVGHKVTDVFDKEIFETTIKPNAVRCMEGNKVRYENWFRFPVHGLRFMSVGYSPYIGPDGDIRGFVVNSKDITEYKNAEEEILVKSDQLQASNQQLIASEQQLLASNQQTNALNQQLIASQQELSIKNEELQSIVYISSHDLKTPLVNIAGFSELLNDHCDELKELVKKCDSDADTKKQINSLLTDDIPADLEYIGTSTKRMKRLIEGLLQVSRIGTIEVKIQKIDMNDVLSNIMNTVKYKTKGLNAEINLKDLPDCTGDKHQITQVFTNLIDNALKYLSDDRKGCIKITGKTKRSKCIYCVEDNGIGIKPAYQDKVFEIYHRLNPRASIEGDGLGLTIVRRILDRHKGRIWVESEPDKGSKFFIELPKV